MIIKALPQRIPTRLSNYDYSTNGAYYITMCTHQKKHLFGKIIDGRMYLNTLGAIANDEWIKLRERFPQTNFDIYQIMPNHIHAIIAMGIDDEIDLLIDEVTQNPDLNSIIAAFKSIVSKRYNKHCRENDIPLHPSMWQRSFYDHIIRSEEGFRMIADYIWHNPINWELDKYNR